MSFNPAAFATPVSESQRRNRERRAEARKRKLAEERARKRAVVTAEVGLEIATKYLEGLRRRNGER